MAVTNSAGVYKFDGTGGTVNKIRIRSIKYIGAASGDASITTTDTAVEIWQESGTANVYNANVDIDANDGITVTLSNNGEELYIYTKP